MLLLDEFFYRKTISVFIGSFTFPSIKLYKGHDVHA